MTVIFIPTEGVGTAPMKQTQVTESMIEEKREKIRRRIEGSINGDSPSSDKSKQDEKTIENKLAVIEERIKKLEEMLKQKSPEKIE